MNWVLRGRRRKVQTLSEWGATWLLSAGSGGGLKTSRRSEDSGMVGKWTRGRWEGVKRTLM